VTRTFVPPPGVVASWLIDLAQPDDVVRHLGSALSEDERGRAARFVFPRDRRRFVVTRACLRTLLADGADPRAVRFVYSEAGKPALEGSTPACHFNVSHSEDLALIAIGRDAALGVDVEAVRPLPDMHNIATRYFTRAETDDIFGVPPAARDLAFFSCWTRKEAFSKALGDGLSLALDRYRVTCRPDEPARLVEIDGSAHAAAEWIMHDLPPAPGFAGAVVYRGPARVLRTERLDVSADVLARWG
jgi:4'-phosphopantetheinyl transferase